MPAAAELSHEYKTVLLIGGELHNIQVVIEKNDHVYEAVVAEKACWKTKMYRESNANSFEFILQE